MPAARGSVRWGRRVAWSVFALAVGWFAVQGGEYGTSDLWRLRGRRRALEDRVADLQRTVDSLAAYRAAVLGDRGTQERIARESFGMVHGDRELLYRFAPRREAPGAADGDARTEPSVSAPPSRRRERGG